MMNAKNEFLFETNDFKVICAWLSHHVRVNGQSHIYNYELKKNYNIEEYELFIKSLDFEYNESYGRQEIDGCIWCENGIWFTRGEYDGSEWWEIHIIPEIPKELIDMQREREVKIDDLLE